MEMPVFYDAFVAYFSTNHPLMQHDFIKADEPNIYEMLLLSERYCFRNQVINIYPESHQSASSNQLKFKSGSVETLKRIIEQDSGYTFLPELAVINLPEKNKQYVKEISYPKPVREVSLVIHRGILKRKLINTLKEHILSSIPLHMKDRNRGQIISWI